jgi:hypothetical protein
MHFFRVSLFSILFVALSFLKATAAGSYAVWATGANSYGGLGDGTTTNRSTPVQVASGVATVSAGWYHSPHHKEKDFWDRALILISRTNSLTQTHALFLEWHCLQSVKKAARYLDQNNNNGSKLHTPAPLASDCLEIFETGEVLLATLGYPLFESVARLSGSAKKDEIFYCTASNAKGRGLYTPEGFVVLKGSTGRKECVPSFAGTSWHRLRLQLVKDGVMREDRDQVVFERDHLFNTPSMAAAFVMARSANGWTSWKNEAGKTLDAVYR